MAADVRNGVTEERIDGGGGSQIVVRSRRPASATRAVVVICHGVNSHGGQYLWTLEQFAAAGFAAYVLDLRGRGKSDGARFYVESIADYVANVSALVKLAKSREAGLPVFLLGHSAGGVVSCTYALDFQAELAGLLCESFAFQVPAPDLVLNIVKGLSRVAPRLPVLKLKNEDFSRDPRAVKALNHGCRSGPWQRAPQKGIPPNHVTGVHHARHARQSHQAERQPVFLRHGRVQRQDAQALRRSLPRSPQRLRQGEGDRGHEGLDHQASALRRTHAVIT
jgi:pimeloyl-ACP methyl ester carboxylesterase